MKYGKLKDTIYDRTVYKTVQSINKSADFSKDCTFLGKAASTGSASGKDVNVIYRAVIDGLNKLAANGVNPLICEEDFEVSIKIFFPGTLREAKLRAMIEYATEELLKINVKFASLDAEVLPGIEEAIVTAFIGTGAKAVEVTKAKPNQDIVMTKWMALEGTALISLKNHRDLETRYPLHLIESTYDFINRISVLNEAAGACKSNVSAMQAVREGGIFNGLWEFADRNGVGLVIDLKKIPVKQETIEVCEFYDINPYKLLSGGSLLIATDNGMKLVSELEEMGIHAAVIGKTTDNNDRIINNDEDQRFLERTGEDEYYKVMYSQADSETEEE